VYTIGQYVIEQVEVLFHLILYLNSIIFRG
jgi:hypothetical protein